MHIGGDVSFMYDYDCLLVKKAVKKILGANQNRKHEISIHLLLHIVCCLYDSIVLHCCMKALFLVAFFSFLRRSNLLADSRDELGRASSGLLRKDVSIVHDRAVQRVYRTKTLLFKDRVLSVPIPAIPKSTLCLVAALRKYMSLVPSQPDDPLFMVPANGIYQPISGKTAKAFLKECIDFLGLDRQVYSLHSFCRGGATFAFRAGAPAQFIKSQGDWAREAYIVYLVVSTNDKLDIMRSITARLQGL